MLVNGTKSRIAFHVNRDIAVYPKYGTEPHGVHVEYLLTFKQENVDEIQRIAAQYPKAFVMLVCIKGREICCITFKEFNSIYKRWLKRVGDPTKQFPLLVTMPSKGKCRVYANAPGTRNKLLDKALLRSRSDFPKMLFK